MTGWLKALRVCAASFGLLLLGAQAFAQTSSPAATAGHKLAAEKVRHRGAIMPRNAAAVH